MAQFQLSVSKTFTTDTDQWSQSERDQFLVALEKIGFKGDGQPSTTQCETAMRIMLENSDDDEFFEENIELGEIDAKDVRVVCVSRQFERFKPGEEKADDLQDAKGVGGAAGGSGEGQKVAPSPATPRPTPQEGVYDPTKKTATTERTNKPSNK